MFIVVTCLPLHCFKPRYAYKLQVITIFCKVNDLPVSLLVYGSIFLVAMSSLFLPFIKQRGIQIERIMQ